ncbi:CGNR zinc finger domain-containing protein [Nocardiopsis chromatogenes]|uniref:CGNR zinc finger domain-containing protein n=1 Tax=Nocardiopsis chromatogenes TaxID=280239 RepID=UPI000349D3EB|nr:CGNR zinc finger domain-containing protein [Nocardiopsis chromatogenes]
MAYNRPPAPDDLLVIEEFCDSARFLYGEDSLASVETARAWLHDHGHVQAGCALDSDALAFLVRARETVRDHLEGVAGARTRLNDLSDLLLRPPQWDEQGRAQLPPIGGDPVRAVAAEVLAALALADLAGRGARLKVCRSPECRWVYYDRSPANNSSWCSMDICGARHKMRAYRDRRTFQGDG